MTNSTKPEALKKVDGLKDVSGGRLPSILFSIRKGFHGKEETCNLDVHFTRRKVYTGNSPKILKIYFHIGNLNSTQGTF